MENLKNADLIYFEFYEMFNHIDVAYRKFFNFCKKHIEIFFTDLHISVELEKLRSECIKQLTLEDLSVKELKAYLKMLQRIYITLIEANKEAKNQIKNITTEPDHIYGKIEKV